MGGKRIHFHKKTSVGGDESLSCPIDLKLILFFLLLLKKLHRKGLASIKTLF
jgi:hypothetical protein